MISLKTTEQTSWYVNQFRILNADKSRATKLWQITLYENRDRPYREISITNYTQTEFLWIQSQTQAKNQTLKLSNKHHNLNPQFNENHCRKENVSNHMKFTSLSQTNCEEHSTKTTAHSLYKSTQVVRHNYYPRLLSRNGNHIKMQGLLANDLIWNQQTTSSAYNAWNACTSVS